MQLANRGRSPHHNWPPPSFKSSVDLGMRQRHVVADVEGLPNRHEPNQPMLKPVLLGSRCDPSKHRESLVHLKRIAGNGDWILAPLPKLLRKLDRDAGLAHAGRSKYRDDLHR